MSQKNSSNNSTSIGKAPLAQDDRYILDLSQQSLPFNILANDKGGHARSLWSIAADNPEVNLLEADDAGVIERSVNGASIWMLTDGSVVYDASTLNGGFLADFDALTAGQSIEDSFVYAMRLGNSPLSWATVTFELQGVNDDPTLAAGAASATEDGSIIEVDLSLLGDDPDADDDGSTLTYTIVSPPLEGAATISDSILGFDPGSDFQDLTDGESRDVTIRVRATDAHGAYQENEVVVTVHGQNDAPIMADGIVEAVEDGPVVDLDLSALIYDPDVSDIPADMSFTLLQGPSEGEATILPPTLDAGPSLRFNPGDAFQGLAAGEVAYDVVKVGVMDAQGAVDEADVTISVTGQNDAPVRLLPAQSIHKMLLSANGDTFTYDLAGFFDDPDSDDSGATLTYDWVPASHHYFSELSFDVDTGSLLNVTADTEDLTVRQLSDGEQLTSFIALTATDSHGVEIDGGIWQLDLWGVNDAPTLEAATVSMDADVPTISVDLSALGDDIDNRDTADSLIYSISAPPALGQTSITGTRLDFTQAGDFDDLLEGETRDVVIQVTATDSGLATATNDVTVQVTGRNDRPVVQPGVISLNADQMVTTLSLSDFGFDADSDDDGSTLVYSLVEQPAVGSISISGSTLTYDLGSIDPSYLTLAEGEVFNLPTARIQATDSHGAVSDVTEFALQVIGVNNAPTLPDAEFAWDEYDGMLGIDLSALGSDPDSDNDGSSLSYAVTGLSPDTYADVIGSTLYVGSQSNLAEGDIRELNVELTATDRHGAMATGDVSVTITGENEAPLLQNSVLFIANEGEEKSWNLAGLGYDGDPDDTPETLLYNPIYYADSGDWSLTGTTLTFKPSLSFESLGAGESDYTYLYLEAIDSHGASSAVQIYDVLIVGKNDAPVLHVNQQLSLQETDTLYLDQFNYPWEASDPDKGETDTLRYEVSGTGVGTAAFMDGDTLVISPKIDVPAGEVVTDTYQVTATDIHGATATDYLTVTVVGVPDPATL